MAKKPLHYFLLSLLLFTTSVSADWYVGGAYTYTIVDLDSPDGEEFSPSVIMFNGGYEIHKYAALELRAGTGLIDGKRETSGVQRELGVNYVYGGYLKLQTGNRNINPYILAGYTEGELEFSNGNITTSDKDNDFSYGIGIEGPLSDNMYVNFEIVQYIDNDDTTIHGIGLGLLARY